MDDFFSIYVLPALIFVNGKVSFGHIAAGYLGMILLGATTLAIEVSFTTSSVLLMRSGTTLRMACGMTM